MCGQKLIHGSKKEYDFHCADFHEKSNFVI
jgi:hypothetical protein